MSYYFRQTWIFPSRNADKWPSFRDFKCSFKCVLHSPKQKSSPQIYQHRNMYCLVLFEFILHHRLCLKLYMCNVDRVFEYLPTKSCWKTKPQSEMHQKGTLIRLPYLKQSFSFNCQNIWLALCSHPCIWRNIKNDKAYVSLSEYKFHLVFIYTSHMTHIHVINVTNNHFYH